jgi:tRNA(Met) cytidine acetyltransferase
VSVVIEFYLQLKELAKQSNHRQLCCLQGSKSWLLSQALTIIEHEKISYYWCGEAPLSVTSTKYSQLLGQDVQLLVLNMIEQFDANMFAAAEGSVCGGSVIIVLLPDSSPTTDKFDTYIRQQLSSHRFPIFQENHQAPILTDSISQYQHALPDLDLLDQQQTVQAIIKTVTGHRRRPLVITANRGRGKSAALGIAAATLINDGISKIIVCAPSKQAVTTLYKHAISTLLNSDDRHKLIFIAPDTLYSEKPECDLLIIDEAAAIPIKLLTAFAEHYSRLVFSTTQFGYEGSGRGFTLRFQQQLNNITPQWRSIQLNQAIRWAENDPVEQFTLHSLCLMQPATLLPKPDKLSKPFISIIHPDELLNNPAKLSAIFSLLVNAHYQTKPSDLMSLLNDSDLSIIIMQQEEKILGVVLISHEGGFSEMICEEVYQGIRRPKGHLVPQSLTFHSGFRKAAMQTYARIKRIAVQPSLQNLSLGSKLLTWSINWANAQQFDHLCASFSASDDLLRFWMKHQLQVLRIGLRKDKSSGQHSFMVNYPLSEQGKILHQAILTDFNQQIAIQLSRQLNRLDSSLLITLWPQVATPTYNNVLTTSLTAYIDANRNYESVEYRLIELLYGSSLQQLSNQQQRCVIEKIIQNHSWQEIVKQHGFTGQKQAQAFLKHCICDLLTHNQEKRNTNEIR